MAYLYIPKRGDLVWLDFDPQAGREQAKRRPALVLSLENYNRATGLMVCCPVTSQVKGYPFEVLLTKLLKTNGVVLADQIRSLDWQARKAVFIEAVGEDVLTEVIGKQKALLAIT